MAAGVDFDDETSGAAGVEAPPSDLPALPAAAGASLATLSCCMFWFRSWVGAGEHRGKEKRTTAGRAPKEQTARGRVESSSQDQHQHQRHDKIVRTSELTAMGGNLVVSPSLAPSMHYGARSSQQHGGRLSVCLANTLQ